MLNLDDIIEFDEEGTNLDFKMVEYRKENYISMIRDVMSMANALNTENKRIIIGVKHNPSEGKSFNGLVNVSDQATFENIIQENIEPNINFKYYSYDYKGIKLGIIEIFNNTDKPYMMKKDYSHLKKGDMWIRKGSRQSKVTREDLDKMFYTKKKSTFENKILIGFGKDLISEIPIFKDNIETCELPSSKRKIELESMLNRLEERYGESADIETSISKPASFLSGMGIFSEFYDSEEKIRVGYNEINSPVYKNKEELIKMIENVESSYSYEDCYYIYEEKSNKINWYIYNDGMEFLEDVVIELYFDSDIFIISPEVYDEPRQYSLFEINPNIGNKYHYPDVYEEDNVIIVREHHKQIRHKTLTRVLFEELRVLVKSNVDFENAEIRYRISAKNLVEHIEGAVSIKIK